MMYHGSKLNCRYLEAMYCHGKNVMYEFAGELSSTRGMQYYALTYI